ncbi:MAG: ABC transporter ATP-binding protein [Acidobacteriota bacterium]
MDAILRLADVSKIYLMGKKPVVALDHVSFDIRRGEFLSIMGPSGSGKSTLLNLLGGLDLPSSGEIYLDGVSYGKLGDDELTRLRSGSIGFVFQFFNLMPTLTALENALLPLLLSGKRFSAVRAAGEQMLAAVGLGGRSGHKPDELSGGEIQRVAIARALVARPKLLLADEPTGNLDTRTGHEILRLLQDSVKRYGNTVVMVTHAKKAAHYGERILHMKDGRLCGEEIVTNAEREAATADLAV